MRSVSPQQPATPGRRRQGPGPGDRGIPGGVYEVILNGAPRPIAAGQTIADLLGTLSLDPRTVAVERNLEIVPRSEYAPCVLANGDKLEVVTFVGGG